MDRPLFRSGNISSCLAAWRSIGASSTVCDWVENGVPVPLSHEPTPFVCHNRKFSAEECKWINSEIKQLLNSGAIDKCSFVPEFVSRINVVPKKEHNQYRLITDLTEFNKFCDPPKFRNEDITSVLEQALPGDKLITFDIEKCFFHVPVRKDFQQYLCFQWRKKHYYWKVLPFGLSCSPYFVYKILRPIVTYLRSKDVRLTVYVDDGFLMSRPDDILTHRSLVLGTFRRRWTRSTASSLLDTL